MKAVAVLGLIAGAAVMTLLVAHYGLAAILRGLGTLGWAGFAAIVVFQLALYGLMGLAWWLPARGRPDGLAWRFIWGRVIRDSAAEALPLSQIGGYVLGARAAALAGVAGAYAAGSTVVDVTVELVAQLAYVLLGLLLLARLHPGSELFGPMLAGVAGLGLLATLFIMLQARASGLIERAALRLGRRFAGAGHGDSGVAAVIRGIHRRHRALSGAALLHFLEWVLSGVQAWVTLRLMGVPIGLGAAVAIDSLLYGLRSVAFMVPNALGVQEGGYVLLGGLFGLGPDSALALSLIRRGRDLAIGIPALLVWQLLEGNKAWRGLGTLDPAVPAATRD